MPGDGRETTPIMEKTNDTTPSWREQAEQLSSRIARLTAEAKEARRQLSAIYAARLARLMQHSGQSSVTVANWTGRDGLCYSEITNKVKRRRATTAADVRMVEAALASHGIALPPDD